MEAGLGCCGFADPQLMQSGELTCLDLLLKYGRMNWPMQKLFTSKVKRVMVWHVEKPCVVVGQGNRSWFTQFKALAEDNITVYRRPSGGQPVFLLPRTLQVSVLLMENQLVNPLLYFRRINGRLIHAIGDQLGLELEARGVSDLATKDERKV